MIGGRGSLRAFPKEIETAQRGGERVMYRKCDSMTGMLNEGSISSNCQSGLVGDTDLLRTRSGWQASKAARNDIDPDILSLSNPRLR